MATVTTIQKIKVGDIEHPLDATTLEGNSASAFQIVANKTSTLTESDTQYPSAKCVYDAVGTIEELLKKI